MLTNLGDQEGKGDRQNQRHGTTCLEVKSADQITLINDYYEIR
jgi:hypothetical protein